MQADAKTGTDLFPPQGAGGMIREGWQAKDGAGGIAAYAAPCGAARAQSAGGVCRGRGLRAVPGRPARAEQCAGSSGVCILPDDQPCASVAGAGQEVAAMGRLMKALAARATRYRNRLEGRSGTL